MRFDFDGTVFSTRVEYEYFQYKKIELSQESVEVSAEKEYIYDKICQ